MNIRMKTLGVFLALCSGMAYGQATNSADITGTVTDTTGAVIPGATVAIKDIDKGVDRTITTNQSGAYDSGPIVPNDHYTIVFSKDGFSSLQRGPMVLQVGVVGMNVQLTVGKTTQQIVVNTDAPLMETTTAELSATLPTDTLQTLPQTGTPDWQSFLLLLPGTSGNAGSSANPGMGSLAANGSMPFSTAMLDGSTISSPMSDNVINTPIFDTIGEVKMSDSNFSAQYGTGGVIFNQISKGGSNSFHGLAYDYLQNTALNAATYAFGTGHVPVTHWNDFGFQVSGPVIKNKVFFLFDWDRSISHSAGSTGFATLPTNNMRAGDFTGLPTIYDPTTQVVDPTTGAVTRQSFASEYGNGNKIPSAMLDPVAKAIQAIYPSESNETFTTNNYAYATPAAASGEQKLFGRFDANPTSRDHIDGSSAYNYPSPITTTASIVAPINQLVIDVENMSGQLSEVHTFSSRTINEARAGWMGEYDLLTSPTIGGGWPAKLGLKFSKADIFPTININNFYGLNPVLHANYRENVFSESDVVTMIRGRHTLHFGGELVAYRADSTAWGNVNGATIGFTGVYTQQANTNATTVGPYADFLLGYAQSWNAGVTPTYYGRLKDPAVFIQDDWKFTPKLTLNLGLRWEGRTGWSDPTKNQRSFDPTITNPATGSGGAMWYAASHTNGRTQLEKNQMNNWLPRVGAAYQLGTKMTVRAGFGMYTFPWNVDSYASCCMGNAISYNGSEVDNTGGISPVVLLSSDGNTNYQGTKGANINSRYLHSPTTPEAYNGQPISYMQYDQPIPRLYNWNLTVQRQLTGNMMAELGYVGSHGTNLIFNTDLNQVPASKLSANDVSSRPYPQYNSISGFTTQAKSDYAALQAQITRRLTNGLMFNFNYTWSHMTDDQDSSGWGSEQGTTIWQNAYVVSANHGAANFDVRQMFKAYGSYDLPFGIGRKFLNHNKALDEAIGGWSMSLTWVGQGGHPFTPFEANSQGANASSTSASGFAWFPNQVSDPKSGGGTIQQWFNPAAYQQPNLYTLGNLRRNNLYGPGLHVMNGSLRKSFPIWERVAFDFTLNATNLPNHPSFADPSGNLANGGRITGTTQGGRTVELVGKLRF